MAHLLTRVALDKDYYINGWNTQLNMDFNIAATVHILKLFLDACLIQMSFIMFKFTILECRAYSRKEIMFQIQIHHQKLNILIRKIAHTIVLQVVGKLANLWMLIRTRRLGQKYKMEHPNLQWPCKTALLFLSFSSHSSRYYYRLSRFLVSWLHLWGAFSYNFRVEHSYVWQEIFFSLINF